MPSQTLLTKIEKPETVDDRTYVQLKQAILDCVLAPGAILFETGLAEQLGVSRTPIRRAIASLEQEGFAIADPSKGYRVAEISQRDLEEMYQLREVLECFLVRETAQRFTQEELDEIESAVVAGEQAREEGDYAGFLAANRAFHHSFDGKYGNRRISAVLASLDEHVYRAIMWGFHLRRGGAVEGLGYADHRLILSAVRDGDVETAVALMRRHLRHGPQVTAESSSD